MHRLIVVSKGYLLFVETNLSKEELNKRVEFYKSHGFLPEEIIIRKAKPS